jgi:hypothetical protein
LSVVSDRLRRMALWSFADIERAVQTSWGADTCDPADLAQWHPGNPARGQCGVTALVLHDLFGGDLMLAEVHVAGTRVGHHYWNRFGAGIELDLTREQFRPVETVGVGRVVVRPAGPPKRCGAQYDLLRTRVLARLDNRPSDNRPSDAAMATGEQPAPEVTERCGPVTGRVSCPARLVWP